MEGNSNKPRVVPARFPVKPDARREERFLVERQISIVYGRSSTPGWLVDCSRHGIRVASPLQLYRNDQFTIVLQPQEQSIKHNYVVRHTGKLWGDIRMTGAQLIEQVDDVEADAILQFLRDRDARLVTP
jgi:hypothetical protein